MGVAVGLSLLVGCSGGGSSSEPTAPAAPATSSPLLTTISVSLSTATIRIGQTATARAAGFDQNGALFTVGAPSWKTTSPGIATVSANGVVTGAAPGQTDVTASVGLVQGRMTLVVVRVPVASVTLTPGAAMLGSGATLQLTTTLVDSSGNAVSDRLVAWTTSDPTRASVSFTGVVTAVAAGVVMITATSEGISASTVITVTAPVLPVATVTVTPSAASVTVGQTLQLSAVPKDAAGNVLPGRIVTWTSNTASIATVSDAGLVTSLAPGTGSIVATSEGQRAAAAITVKGDSTSVIVVGVATPTLNQMVGDTVHIVASARSTYPVLRVVASVGSRELSLLHVFGGATGVIDAWVGDLDLAGTYYGTLEMVVTATDARSSIGADSLTITHQKTELGGNAPPPGKKQLLPVTPGRIP
jgi:uncharacterized protein YjdB